MKIVGIAGGSGAGKSTVSYELEDANPELIEVLNLDDYQKLGTAADLPMLKGMINWDHPDIIRWDDLVHDLQQLQQGNPVTIQVWAHRSNPDYHSTRKMISRTIQPKPMLLVEGYLALYHPDIRAMFDTSFYLDISDEVRNKRRGKVNIVTDKGYTEKVLIPMHKQFVEPTKDYADHFIDVSDLSVEEVSKRIAAIVLS